MMSNQHEADAGRDEVNDSETNERQRSSYAEFRMSGGRQSGTEHDVPSDARQGMVGPLFTDEQARELYQDWEDVQASFVDDPRRAVSQADHLVDRAMRQITDTFARERRSLEHQWDSGTDVSTEELRRVLQRYRTFFNRLLSV
jgi:hypothetical protein